MLWIKLDNVLVNIEDFSAFRAYTNDYYKDYSIQGYSTINAKWITLRRYGTREQTELSYGIFKDNIKGAVDCQ